MNRALLEAARAMMYHAGMPEEFWAEDMNTAAFTRCMIYVHVANHQRKKLEEKSRKCIFVGYPDGT